MTLSLYGNNSASTTSYHVAGSTFSLGSNTFDIWLGNTRISGSALTGGQLAAGTGVDSIMFYGESSSGNVGTLSLDNIVYANELPTGPSDAAYWAPQAGGGGSGTWTTAGTTWATAAGTQGSLTQGTGTLIFGDAGGTVTVGDSVSAAAGLQITANGYVFTGGTISLDGPNAGSNTITVNSSVSGTIAAVLAGSAGMTKAGAGTLIASGSNSTSGFRVGASAATPTNGGTVILTAAAAAGTGQLQLNFGTLEATTPLTFANGLSIGGRSNGVAVLDGTNAITFSGSSNFFCGNGTSGALRLDVNNTTTLNRLGATSSGGGTATGITLGGTGRLILAGDGTGFADSVTVQSGLTLELANATSLATATLDTTTGTIAYGVASTALGGVTGSGNLALPATSLTVGGNNASTTYSGQFSGAGSLIKTGTGALTLSAANGHSGGTTLSAGTLVATNVGAFGSGTVLVGGGTLDLGGQAVANAIATTGGAISGGSAYAGAIGVGGLTAFSGTVAGIVNVASSGTLAGNGSAFNGVVTFATGGVHAPGSSPGAQTFTGGLVYDPGSAIDWDLWDNTASVGSAGTLYDAITVTTGSLSIGSTAALNLIFSGTGSTVDWSHPFWTTDHSWTVIAAAAAGSSTGVFTLGTVGNDQQGDALTAVLPNASFHVTRSGGGDIILNFVSVPEPSTLTLASLGLLALAGLSARKRFQ